MDCPRIRNGRVVNETKDGVAVANANHVNAVGNVHASHYANNNAFSLGNSGTLVCNDGYVVDDGDGGFVKSAEVECAKDATAGAFWRVRDAAGEWSRAVCQRGELIRPNVRSWVALVLLDTVIWALYFCVCVRVRSRTVNRSTFWVNKNCPTLNSQCSILTCWYKNRRPIKLFVHEICSL